ncbi:MAG TPA: hypothetical protein DHW02_02770 [Ktedonobacter sp.]|nr:hypothetical protein [Ktedonobacter sp.]
MHLNHVSRKARQKGSSRYKEQTSNELGMPTQEEEVSASSARTNVQLEGIWLLLARGAWVALVLPELVVLMFMLLAYGGQGMTFCPFISPVSCAVTPLSAQGLHRLGISPSTYDAYNLMLSLLESLGFLGVGGFIFWRKSNEPIALIASFFLVSIGIAPFITSTSHPLDTLFLSFYVLSIFTALGYFLVTFPDGRFVPGWTWVLVVLWAVRTLFFLIPGPANIAFWPPTLNVIDEVVNYGGTLVLLVYRYARVFNPSQCQQAKWLLFGFGGLFVVIILYDLIALLLPELAKPDSLYVLSDTTLTTVTFLLIPLSVAMAILRYRLWDIDILINRTLVYTLLTVSTLGLYVLVVFGASALLHTSNDLFFSLLATALIAVLFQPLRQQLQLGVNRLLYGQRNEPYRVLSHLGQRLQETLPADTLLLTIVETVAHALKLPYVALTWKQDESSLANEERTPLASFGMHPNRNTLISIAILHQGKHLGNLLLSPRQRGEELTPADMRLVRDLAPQIAMALHSTLLLTELQHLTSDLQRSRESLVTAREEERRRLRRDLHDGLGPQLSSQTLTLSAIKKVLHQDPESADRLLSDAIVHAQDAVSDIRRLVYALRPPALDDLGLRGALEEQMNQYRTSGVVMTLEAPETLPPLPAALEMACYRIVQEALTNVVRHAHATCATVHLEVRGAQMGVEVTDNGQGLPPGVRSGVGLRSLRERAEELGGTCIIEALPTGGTRVAARLPWLSEYREANEDIQKGETIS